MPGYSVTVRNARLDAIRDAIDGGAGAGTLKFYSGGQPPTGGSLSPSSWVASTAYAVDDLVQPTTPNGHFYKCTVAGTSGSSEPTWPTDGTTVTDGGVTWEDVGEVPTLLGTLTFSDPSAPNAADGVSTYSAITEDSSADADGTATFARAAASDGTFVADFTVSAEGGGGDIELNTTSIITGGPISISSFIITGGNA